MEKEHLKKRSRVRLPEVVRLGSQWIWQKKAALALYLQSHTNKYSTRKKKNFLVMFCLLLTGISIEVMVQSFQGGRHHPFTVEAVKTLPVPSPEKLQTVAGEEWRHIQKFITYLDSLDRSPDGKRFKDSLLSSRPHLWDSLQFLVQLYSPSNKK